MAHKTRRQQLAAALETRGSRLLEQRKKVWVYSHPTDPAQRYFLGSSGALRVGRNLTSSISLTDTAAYQRLLATPGSETGGKRGLGDS